MCATCGCGTAEDQGNPRHHHEDASGHDHDHLPGHEHAHLHGHPHPHQGDQGHAHPHGPSPEHRAGDDRTLAIEQDILAKNDALAAENRSLFASLRLAVFNLTSSPGSGKTTLLEALGVRLAGRVRLSVIEGDQETTRDAERVRAVGIPAVQINTRSGCHLDAGMVGRAVRELDPAGGSLLMIENVGNLVCPALFDLGERSKVVLMSVTEGEDKPLKYPHMFRAARVLLLSKIDLLPHLDFDVTRCLEHARRVNPALRTFLLSAKSGVGVSELCDWLVDETRGAAA
jgi:hydrogenase nickel incorporation protein HypB